MTADGLAGEVRVTESGAGSSRAAVAVITILAICDRALGEIGRRSHLFGWLRDPNAGPQQWLAIDAYYPGNRLVVLCHEQPSPHDRAYDELVPAHGLRLLRLDPADLVRDPSGPQAAIERMIAELGELRRPAAPPLAEEQVRESVIARAVASLSQPVVTPAPERPQRLSGSRAAAAERAARFVRERSAARAGAVRPAPAPGYRPAAARRPSRPRGRPRARLERQLPGSTLLVGLALAGVLFAEIYLGVEQVALSAGHVLLAFGIALDGCGRALGTVAAASAGRQDWAWLCAIGGSPAVAAFALFQSAGPVEVEPAPLAGLISILASAVVVIALLAWLLGI